MSTAVAEKPATTTRPAARAARPSPSLSTETAPSILDRALATVPGLTEADTALAVVAATRLPDSIDSRATHAKLYTDARKAARAAAESGLPISDEVCADLAQLVALNQQPYLFNQLLRDLRAELTADRRRIYASGADSALEYLASELDELMSRVRAIASAARTVARQDRPTSDEWAELTLLADEYEAIRAAQLTITTNATRNDEDWRTAKLSIRVGLERDFLAGTTFWVDRRLESVQKSNPKSDAATRTVEWLRDVDTSAKLIDTTGASPWWPTPHREQHLLALATSGMAWLPTLHQASKAFAAAWAATEPVRGELTVEQESARRALFDVLDIEDDSRIPPEQHSKLRPIQSRW